MFLKTREAGFLKGTQRDFYMIPFSEACTALQVNSICPWIETTCLRDSFKCTFKLC